MDSDSSGDSQRLKEFLEKSFSDKTDSDDEDFRLNTSDDIKDNDLSESSISEQDTEKELQNGPKGDSSPEKVGNQYCTYRLIRYEFLLSKFLG